MKKHTLINTFKSVLFAAMAMTAASCSKSNDGPDGPELTDSIPFHVAFAVDPEGSSQTYVQGFNNLNGGKITFDGFGFAVPSTRTARFYASKDGKSIYNLDYGGGTVTTLAYNGGQNYAKTDVTNVELAMGTKNPRWTKVNEENGLLHNVTNKIITQNADGTGAYVRHSATAKIANVKFAGLEITKSVEFEIPFDAAEAAEGIYVFRMDAPVVANGKVYYGMGKQKYDPATAARVDMKYKDVATLVLDYPSLENPKVIKTSVNGAKGGTLGYRTPVSHIDEKGDIYQIITVSDKTYDTHILRIRNGAYDESYDFNLSDLVGSNTISNGWFYVEGGVGYVPYANSDKGLTSQPVWEVARIDLYNKSAVVMDLPDNLWLQQYQYSVTRYGKFYMAIAPESGTGNIYMFDYKSTSPTAYTKGASITSSAGTAFIGIF